MPSLDAYNNFIAQNSLVAESPDVEYRWTIRGGLTVRVPARSPVTEGENVTIAPFAEPIFHDNADTTDNAHFSLVPENITLTPLPSYKNGAGAQSVLPLLDLAEPVSHYGASEWTRLPKHLKELSQYIPPSTGVEDARYALLERLLDPALTLEETAKLLGVCAATVRRYANNGKLIHQRTPGNQRRFRLSEVAAFLHRQNGVVEE